MTSINQNPELPRRSVLAGAAAASVASCLSGTAQVQAKDEPIARPKICAFIKFVQSLPYDQLAETIASLGFDGIEATVRDGGHVAPERVEEELPKLAEALKKHDLEITIMASSVSRADEPHSAKVLETAAGLGVKRYRMKYHRYNLKRPVVDQIRELRPVIKDLVQMGRELGLQALYQNHAGATTVGSPVWDLYELFRVHAAKDIGVAFDIRHATVEGGLAWPLHFNLVQSMLGAVYVKDFVWGEGRNPRNVPLGKGRVDPSFFKLLRQQKYNGVISLHVEYLPKAGVPANVTALKNDLATLRSLLGQEKG